MSFTDQYSHNSYNMIALNNSTDTDNKSLSVLGNVMVWGLILGTLLSYTPQYYKIYKSRTTKGVSEKSIIFGVYSCLFNVLGTIQQDYKSIHNCRINHNCYETWIPIAQLFSPFFCMVMLYWFYLSYVSGEYSLVALQGQDDFVLVETYLKRLAIYRRGRQNLMISTAITTISLIINTVGTDFSIKLCGELFNIISAILSVVMWIPQIVKTYELKSAHALSLIALSIHSFGCFVTIFYQSFIMKQNFLVISNYFIGGICEGSIVLMALYYKRQKRLYKQHLEALSDEFSDENYYNTNVYYSDDHNQAVTL